MLFLKSHDKLADDQLMKLAGQGDEQAFRVLVERHQPMVLDFAYRFLGDAQEARDVAQETLLRVYRNAATYRREGTFRAWVMRIARNLCLDHVRKVRPVLMENMPEQADSETPLTAALRRESAEALSSAVRSLPESQRTALILRHNEGMRYDQIAEAMDTTVAAVESLLVRARKGLRRQIEGA
ncbi:RNA polymerase sigma factor [Desulfocurvus sp. DL9XJH121]